MFYLLKVESFKIKSLIFHTNQTFQLFQIEYYECGVCHSRDNDINNFLAHCRTHDLFEDPFFTDPDFASINLNSPLTDLDLSIPELDDPTTSGFQTNPSSGFPANPLNGFERKPIIDGLLENLVASLPQDLDLVFFKFFITFFYLKDLF